MVIKAQPEHAIQRRIYFYQMRSLDETRSVTTFDIAKTCRVIRSLKDDDLYLRRDDGTDLCVVPENDSETRLRYGKVRRDLLPPVESRGNLRPLILEKGEGLFECIHVIFFPGGLVGADFNLLGPRISTLNDFFQEKVPEVLPLAFDVLLRHDLAAKLAKYGEIRQVVLRIDTSRSAAAAVLDENLSSAVRSLKDAGVGSVELILRSGFRSRKPLAEHLWNGVRTIVGKPELRDSVDKLNVKAVNRVGHDVEWLDLLEDQLVTVVKIFRSEFSGSDEFADFMYDQIQATHTALLDELNTAVRIGT